MRFTEGFRGYKASSHCFPSGKKDCTGFVNCRSLRSYLCHLKR